MSNTDADTHTDTITYAIRFSLLIVCKRACQNYIREAILYSV